MDVLKDILDNISDSVIVIDAYGQIVLYNNEALRIQKSISGKPIEIGSYLTDTVSPDRKHTVTDILTTIKRQKKPIKNFAEYLTPFGTSIFLEINFIPVFSANKELQHVNIITQDITARKIFEQKMRAVSVDVSNLIEQAHAMIFSVDSLGYIVEWNNHCEKITGHSKKHILSQKLADVLVREYNVSVFNDLMASVLKNTPVENYQFSIEAKSGSEVVVMVSATPRTNAHGQVIGVTFVGQDITELTTYRRSLEKQIENKTAALEQVLKREKEAVEMKSRFVSIASHEFRSPLSSIDFAANFIKQNAATIGKKKLNEKVAVIERHVNYMSHLLEDVLTYSKNDNGRIKIFPSKICLDVFLEKTVEEVMCSTRHSHHICVSTNQLGAITTDEKLLRNILINLLTNAVKFSPRKEDITLNVLDHKDFVTMEVRDEGMGISEDEIEIIFEPFVRGKCTESIQGTGLGLSIVKKAVEILNGTIEVESRLNRGSVFRVTIPRQVVF